MKKLPLGIQSFREIMEKGYLYVDKTEAVYNMVSQGKEYVQPYINSEKEIILVGISFSQEERNVGGWEMEKFIPKK